MALELLDLRHGRILPKNQLILTETMTGTYFSLMLRPKEGANLTTSVDRVQDRAGIRIPELDGAICGAAAACEQPPMERTPGQGLHRRLVMGQCEPGADARRVEICAATTGHGRIPQAKQVLVTAAG